MEFNYLLQMPIWSLTYEKVQQLQNEHSTKQLELEQLQAKKIEDIWTEELNVLEKVLDEVWDLEEKQRQNQPRVKGDGGKKVRQKKKAPKKEAGKDSDNSNLSNNDGTLKEKNKDKPPKTNGEGEKKHRKKKENKENAKSTVPEAPKEKPIYEMTLAERLELRQKMNDQQKQSPPVSLDQELASLKQQEWDKKQQELSAELKMKKKAKNPLTMDSDEENSIRLDDIMSSFMYRDNKSQSRQETQNQMVSVGDDSRPIAAQPKTRKIKKVVEDDSESDAGNESDKDSMDDFIVDSDEAESSEDNTDDEDDYSPNDDDE